MFQTELINFELVLDSVFWDQPPAVKITIDGEEKFNGPIAHSQTIKISHLFKFNQPHVLSLERYNKTPQQCRIKESGELDDQVLYIKQIIIDGIDVRNLIWHNSVFQPIYPKLWAAQQLQQGNTLKQLIIGETTLGHNGTWTFNFTSPFWKFLINQMGS